MGGWSDRAGRGGTAFITFEGGEGAGKSTQAARLASRLRERGCSVVATREPGGSPLSESIRVALLQGLARDHGPFAEALLFTAARASHVRDTIRPALDEGAVVICDRFVDSTRVYQGALGAVGDGELDVLDRVATGGLRPGLTLILDVPVPEGLARASARRSGSEPADRFEGEGRAFHAEIRRAFLARAAAEPSRCVVVDGSQDPDEVADVVWSTCLSRLPHLAGHGA